MAVSELIEQSTAAGAPSAARFDVASNLKLLPKFSDKDPDTFFCMFEQLADSRNWPDQDRTFNATVCFYWQSPGGICSFNI